jgi:hypothetical protein
MWQVILKNSEHFLMDERTWRTGLRKLAIEAMVELALDKSGRNSLGGLFKAVESFVAIPGQLEANS